MTSAERHFGKTDNTEKTEIIHRHLFLSVHELPNKQAEVPIPPRRPQAEESAKGPQKHDNDKSHVGHFPESFAGRDDHRPRGIDLSKANGDINFNTLKHHHVKFVFIKATDGATFKDPLFHSHWNKADRSHIAHGAYHFFRPGKPVEHQVANFMQAYKHVKHGQLPPVLDVENSSRPGQNWWAGLSPTQATDKVVHWLSTVEKRTGQRPLIYANRETIEHTLGNDARLSKYDLWLAQTDKRSLDLPDAFSHRTFWQYTFHGRLKGIKNHLDFNVFDGSNQEFNQYLKKHKPHRA
jgi:lysozyme